MARANLDERKSNRSTANRWELYRALGDPARVLMLSLVADEELSVGELAQAMDESQPTVSRHAAALRRLGLIQERREGTRVFLRASEDAAKDRVIIDAIEHGRALAESMGVLALVNRIVRSRDSAAREFFAKHAAAKARPETTPDEFGAYLTALGALLPSRELAVDVGTGDGAVLELLAPIFTRVIALDRSKAQLAQAQKRAERRGFTHIEFVAGELDGPEIKKRVEGRGGADVVFASRFLHHNPQPAKAVARMAQLARKPGNSVPAGAIVVLDYEPYADDALRSAQADLWMGFSEAEIGRFFAAASLSVDIRSIPRERAGTGPDSHLPWFVAVGRATS